MLVKVYSTSSCPFCHALMDWLDSIGVEYEEVDAASIIANSNSSIKSVPATEINGKLIFGFDRPAIRKALKEATK